MSFLNLRFISCLVHLCAQYTIKYVIVYLFCVLFIHGPIPCVQIDIDIEPTDKVSAILNGTVNMLDRGMCGVGGENKGEGGREGGNPTSPAKVSTLLGFGCLFLSGYCTRVMTTCPCIRVSLLS